MTTIRPVTGEAGVANANSLWSARMSPTSTDRITLTGSQRRDLTRMTRAGRTEQRLVTRGTDISYCPSCSRVLDRFVLWLKPGRSVLSAVHDAGGADIVAG